MAIGAIFLRLVSVIIRKGKVQPWLTQNMRCTGSVAVMATGIRFPPVGPAQYVALVAGVDLIYIFLVTIGFSVRPTGSCGCLGAGGPEMTLAAFLLQVVAGCAILIGLGRGSVKP